MRLELQVESVVVETVADRRQDTEIWEMGGKGVFVKEVQAAVLDGRADLAVHSAKDLPAVGHPDLVMAAVPERADPRDVLIGATMRTLSPGATIATGSVRRRAQLAWIRPDLTFTGLRGNIATRLTRIPAGGAIVMAAAAVDRLNIDLASVEHEVLPTSVMLPQVAQGALAVECRADDDGTVELLHAIEHPPSRRAVDAERAFLGELGGDCDLPAAAHASDRVGRRDRRRRSARVARRARRASAPGDVRFERRRWTFGRAPPVGRRRRCGAVGAVTVMRRPPEWSRRCSGAHHRRLQGVIRRP